MTAHSMVCAQALGSGGLAPTASSSGKARNCPLRLAEKSVHCDHHQECQGASSRKELDPRKSLVVPGKTLRVPKTLLCSLRLFRKKKKQIPKQNPHFPVCTESCCKIWNVFTLLLSHLLEVSGGKIH